VGDDDDNDDDDYTAAAAAAAAGKDKDYCDYHRIKYYIWQ